MNEKYPPDYFKVGMVVLYMLGMRDDLVGTINIITHIKNNAIYTRRWNDVRCEHEVGEFNIPINKSKLKIIGGV